MLALYILGGLIALFCLLLSSPIFLQLRYEEGVLHLILKVWGTPFTLLPSPPKEKIVKKDTVSDNKKQKNRLLVELETTFKQDGVGAVVHWMGQLAGMLSRAIGRLLKAVTVKHLKLHMRVSGEDAAAVATNYGTVCGTFYPAYGALCAVVKVKKQDICIDPDFLEQGSGVLLDMICRICLWRVLGAAIAFFWDLIRLYFSTDTVKTERTIQNGRK
jgi:hypothetical protein